MPNNLFLFIVIGAMVSFSVGLAWVSIDDLRHSRR